MVVGFRWGLMLLWTLGVDFESTYIIYLFIYLFIYLSIYLSIYLFIFTLFTVDLKLLIYTQKKSLYSLYSNNIELIDVNSVTEQEMQPFPKESLKSMLTNWHTYTHLFTHR